VAAGSAVSVRMSLVGTMFARHRNNVPRL